MSVPEPAPNPYYPELLLRAEDELIAVRRSAAELAQPTAARRGLALSGGGIRSATFNLGILQALARARLLRRFDFLSTVSGGGYAGGFFGAWVAREPNTIAGVEGELGAATEGKSVRFLRENGRYLAPNGAGDVWAAASTVLRSWLAVLAVLGLFAFTFFLVAAWAREFFWPMVSATPISVRGFDVELSPLLTLALAVTVLAVVPLIVAFWSMGGKPWRLSWVFAALVALGLGWAVWDSFCPTCVDCEPMPPFVQGAFVVAGLVAVASWIAANVRVKSVTSGETTAPWVPNAKSHGSIEAGHRLLTDWLALALAVTVVLLILGLADTLAASCLLMASPNVTVAVHAAFGAAIMAGKYLWSKLGDSSSKKKRLPLPVTWLAGIVAALLALMLYTLLDLWALRVALQLDAQFFGGDDSAAWCLFWLAAGMIFVSVLIGQAMTFLNLSSHQALYAARITRAYLGATNPIRQKSDDQDITDPVPGDQIPYHAYRPHAHGGPLHLINVTVNETVSGKSQIEQRDRKGFGLTVGPAAISAGRVHHALLFRPLLDPAAARNAIEAPQPSEANQWNGAWLTVFPLATGDGQFPLFDVKERAAPTTNLLDRAESALMRVGTSLFPSFAPPKRLPLPPAEETPTPFAEKRVRLASRGMEALPLGRWVGVSGAAFSAGLGAHTSLGISFLAGLFNVRLGYWWDSGVGPHERIGARTPPNFPARIGAALAVAFPVQMHLGDEVLARFHGPARRRWNLTDGGHFENTAAYELIRRRVPVIVVCDCGEDAGYNFEDVGNLVRLARTDFDAEIRFLGAERLEKLLSEPAQKIIGALSELKLSGDEGDEPAPRFNRKHAALATVFYPGDSKPGSVLLLIKPGVSGDEPADVVNYHAANPAFPQQSTADQFFDAAQWESYRKLGEVLGDALFGAAAGLDLEKILGGLRDDATVTGPDTI